jgi:ribose transport system permease protein
MIEKETLPVQATEPARPRLRLPALRAVMQREAWLLVLTVVIFAVFSVRYNVTFLSAANFSAILRNLAFEGMLAIGMMLLIVGGMFDLSVGAMASMVGVVTGWLMKSAGVPVPLAIAGGLAVAAAGGLLNGFVVARVRVNPLITTLGTMGVFQGIALLIGGPGITFLPESFTRVGQAELLGLQMPVWLLLMMALAAHYALAHTRFFRKYYFIGSNEKAARLSGINVERMQMLGFTLTGVIAGLAGIVYSSRIATASSTLGVGAELQAITAVILGGASLAGGQGTIRGAMIGVFFMALMKNVLIISRVTSEWQGIVLGGVLVAAVALDSVMTRRRQ